MGISHALKHIEVEYDEGVESMPVNDRLAAIHLISYLEGIRDGSWFNAALAHSKKYGEDARVKADDEVDIGFCLEDPYFEIVPKLDAFITRSDYEDDTEMLSVLMDFLEAEYSCEQD